MIIAIDAGGTSLKSAIVDCDGRVLDGTFSQTPSRSEGTKSEVLDTIAGVVSNLLSAIGENRSVDGIAFGYPGPFDYANGRCLMDHKYLSIYGVPILPEIRSRTVLPDIPAGFYHDLHAFAFGEFMYGAGRNARNLLCVSIGTGLGTGYIRNGTIIPREDGGPRFSIFMEPYGGATLEDLVSARGISRRYGELRGERVRIDPKDVEIRANRGDAAAGTTYREVGEALGSVLGPIIRQNDVDTLVFGGQISRAWKLFVPAFRERIGEAPSLGTIEVAHNLEFSSLTGAAALLRRSQIEPCTINSGSERN